MIVPKPFMLVSATASGLNTLAEVTKKKKIKAGTRSATMNFRLRPIRWRKESKPKGKGGNRKFLRKS